MNFTAPIRVGLGLVTAGVAEVTRRIPGTLVRLPIEVLNRTLHAGELAAKGYGELTQRGEQTVSLVRQRLGMRDEEPRVVRHVQDPFGGGRLEPAEDIRDSVWLTPEDAQEIAETESGAALEHDELPLEDYDHLTLGSLRARIRGLDLPELVQLREYEQAHANRLQVLKSFDTRIAKLSADSGKGDGSAP